MKQVWCTVLVICFLGFMTDTCFAADSEPSLWQGEWESFTASLPEELTVRLGNDSTHTTSSPMDFGEMVSYVCDTIARVWPSAIAVMRDIIMILLVTSVFSVLKYSWNAPIMHAVLDWLCVLVIAIRLADTLSTLLKGCLTYIAALTELMSGITPLSVTISVISGGVNQAVVVRSGLMLICTLLQNMNAVFFLPVVKVSYALSVVGQMGGFVRTEGFARLIRQIFGWAMAFITVLFSFLIGIQTVISKTADSFQVRTIQFALGNFVPIVGGTIAGALSTVLGSIARIRRLCGVYSAVAILVLLLPIVFELILHRTALGVCRAVAQVIGCDREEAMIGEVNALLGYLLALVALSAVLFLFVLALLCSGTAGG